MQEVRLEQPVYIYLLRDPSAGGAIRYVGQTVDTRRRLAFHLSEAATGHHCHRCRWIRKLAAAGIEPILEIIEQTTTETWAEREKYWIAFYRAAGAHLCNHTDGGEGALGRKQSDASRAKMSATKTGKPASGRPFIVTDSFGEHHLVFSIKQWCAEHDVPEFYLRESLRRQVVYRGWQACEAEWREGDWQLPVGWQPYPKFLGRLGAWTPERKRRFTEQMSGAGNPSHGRAVPEETRAKIAASLRGRPSPKKGIPQPKEPWVVYIALSPEGIQYIVTNLREFCEEHGLRQSGMQGVMSGHWRNHKGWRCRRAGDPPFEVLEKPLQVKKPRDAEFILTSPTGENVRVRSLIDFCRENGFHESSFYAILRGTKKAYRGWTIRRPEE